MSCRRTITRWIVVIGGFLQNRGKPTGIVRLWSDLHCHRDEHTELLLLNWSDDPREYAGLIWALAQEHDRPVTVLVFGFSWGGQTAINLCRELQRRGLQVRHLVLSDAVYRHWWLPRRWTSLLRWVLLTVPANVRHVTWFRQRFTVPRGHEVVAEDPKRTLVERARVLQLDHVYMDDAREFHLACHDAVAAASAA